MISKEIQCRVFGFLVDHIAKNRDSKYDSVMWEFPEIKLKNEFPKNEIIDAVKNLIRIGYLIELDCSRGMDIRITKLGYERWNKRCVK